MKGVPALRDILEENDYMCKLDLKDAYVVTSIHQESRKYLTFRHKGKVYQYKTLAFGMSVSPRVFSKLMRYAMEPMRKQGIRLVYYFDDICILGKTKMEAAKHTMTVASHLENLGFVINKEKSILTPSKQQDFLGFTFNSKTMIISVPNKKLAKITMKVNQAMKDSTEKSCRWIASLLGKMTSVIPAIGEALLHIRYLQRDLARNLHQNHQQWDANCNLSTQSRQELQWWKTWSQQRNGLPIRKEVVTPDLVIHVDASNSGWGVASNHVNTAGLWKEDEQLQSINVRELRTILFALQLHVPKFRGSAIKIYTDNITALKYVTKSGGTSSPILQGLALEIQELCNQYQLQIEYQHIPGIQNIQADRLSRLYQQKQQPLYEAQLTKKLFNQLQQQWGRRTIDAFANRTNTQLPTFWSLHPDPLVHQQDAFQQTWTKKGMYLFPPWKFIPAVIHTIYQQKIKEAVLITPYWPTQFWFPMLTQMKQVSPP